MATGPTIPGKAMKFTNTHPIFSSTRAVLIDHFAQARLPQPEPEDQRAIPPTRLGFHGVLDKSLDWELLDRLAELRPDWQYVLIGPVVRMNAHALPRRANIHYLGSKSHDALPAYVAGWDVAILPFVQNKPPSSVGSTRTLEYLASGRAVVATPIADVVENWARCGMVSIAKTAPAFMHAVVAELARSAERAALYQRADDILHSAFADDVWHHIDGLVPRSGRGGRVAEFF